MDRLDELLRHDGRAALQRARELLDAAGTDSDDVAYQRVLLVKGAAQARIGQTEDGARVLREVNTWASRARRAGAAGPQPSAAVRAVPPHRRPRPHARARRHRASTCSMPSVRPGSRRPPARARGCAGCQWLLPESLQRYEEAAKLAERSGDQHTRLTVLNNLAYTQYEAGLRDRGGRHRRAAVGRVDAQRPAAGDPPRDTIARAYTMVGRLDDAVAVLEPACRATDRSTGEDCDGLVMALLTLTEIQRLAGGLDDAQASLDRCRTLIDRYDLTGQRTEAQREQAELYAARGRTARPTRPSRSSTRPTPSCVRWSVTPAPARCRPSSRRPRPDAAASTSGSCPCATR